MEEVYRGFPGDTVVRESICQCKKYKKGGFDPRLGRLLGIGNGKLLQYSCLGNPRTEEPGGLQSMWSQRVGYN